MKVLLVRTYPDQLDPNRYNVQEIGLASALRRAGVLCDIILFLAAGKDHIEIRGDGTKIYWKRGFNIAKNALFFHLNSILDQYDVIQVHEYDQIQSWKIYTKYHKCKVIIYHGPYYSTFNRGYNLKCAVFDRFFLSRSRQAKECIQCLTKSPLAEQFLRSKGFCHVSVVGVGLNPEPFLSENPKQSIVNIPENKINLIYVGKLEERRNTKFLLRLMKELARRSSRYHLTLVGNGSVEYLAELEPELKSLKQQGCITHYNKLSQAELSILYREADLMLFPSMYEIYGMVLMEAMYFGVLCISSWNGGSSLLIENEEDGVILPSFDVMLWADCVERLSNDDEKMRDMKAKAASKIKDRFTWDKLVPKFIEAYSAK